jgi:hypothetical protein
MWVLCLEPRNHVREAEGGTGGIFLFKRSALRFAERNSGARGCATMFLTERLELDLANRGNRLVGWIGAVLNVLARYIPEYPPPIPMGQKKQKGKWQWNKPSQPNRHSGSPAGIYGRSKSDSIGFGAKIIAPEDRKQGEIFREVEPEDLLKYGLIPEFVGRLPVITTLEDLDEASLKLILTQPKNALVKHYQRLFEMEGVDLTMAAEALGAIARKALDRKTGARGLRSIMEAILLDSMFDLPSLEGVKEVMISQQVVEGTAGPLYMYTGGARAI